MEYQIRDRIHKGDTVLGIELGSTRIKSILLGPDHSPIASGSFTWENNLVNGLWTYRLDDAWTGLQKSYGALAANVMEKYGVRLETVGAIGISGMMHGYLAFNKEGNQIAPFLTWRNTNTGKAAAELTELFHFNIPLRWSISQLYQAILNGEEHVGKIAYLSTLAGYIHWKLSGRKVVGIGDASGMFPIDSNINSYNQNMLQKFREKIAEKQYRWDIERILPKVLVAGENAGFLTEEGARLLDPSGALKAGIPMAPPEGDAGTGMTATNSVAARTGNVSAGTSIFAMVVMEKQLSKVYPEIDMITTPSGKPVAMVHCNNCTSDMDAWTAIFKDFSEMAGAQMSDDDLFTMLYQRSLQGDKDCGGITVYNYLSGEPITGFETGCPMVVRRPDSRFTLANFMRSQLYSTMASLVIGMKTLREEHVKIDRLTGHGGLFKTPVVGQKYMAAATKSPISVMDTAGEGGPYGMALLAAYMKNRGPGETLESYLEKKVFATAKICTLQPDDDDINGFSAYLAEYRKMLPAENAAVSCIGG